MEPFKQNYRSITTETLASRIYDFYSTALTLIKNDVNIGLKSQVNDREYLVEFPIQKNVHVYQPKDHYEFSLKPIAKDEDSMDELVSDIMFRNTKNNFYLYEVYIKTKEIETHVIDVTKEWHHSSSKYTAQINTEHTQAVSFFKVEKVNLFLKSKPLSLGKIKIIVKALDKVAFDASIDNYLSAWNQLDYVLNPQFFFMRVNTIKDVINEYSIKSQFLKLSLFKNKV